MENNELLFGRNPVREALKNGHRVDKILVEENVSDGSIRELIANARAQGIVVKKVARSKLDELCMPFGRNGRTANHQGIAAYIAPFPYVELEEILENARQSELTPLVLVLDGVTDPGNLGAILRSAECFGAAGVILPKRRSATLTSAVSRAASGAAEYVRITKVANLTAALKQLKEAGYWIAAADMEGQPADTANLTGPLALVIGSEGEGISRLVKETCDFAVRIDLKGQIQSLNASVAAAVLMYEKRRQDG